MLIHIPYSGHAKFITFLCKVHTVPLHNSSVVVRTLKKIFIQISYTTHANIHTMFMHSSDNIQHLYNGCTRLIHRSVFI